MMGFVLRRLLQMIPTILAVVLIIFFIFSVVPGSFLTSLMSEGRNMTNADVLAQMNAQFGLDDPIPVRLWNYVSGLLQFDLGISYRTREPVTSVLAPRLWPSIQLAIAAMTFAAAVGIPLGFMAALRPGSLFDSLTMVTAVSGLSVPEFWLGLLLMYVFALQLGWLPSFGYQENSLRHLILPATNLALAQIALVIRLTRTGVQETMPLDFVKFARARGVPKRSR